MKAKTVAHLLRQGGGKMSELNPVPKKKFWSSKATDVVMDAITIIGALGLCIGLATCF